MPEPVPPGAFVADVLDWARGPDAEVLNPTPGPGAEVLDPAPGPDAAPQPPSKPQAASAHATPGHSDRR